MNFFARHRGLLVSFTLLLAGAIIPWIIWGDALDATFTVEGSRAWIAGFGAAGRVTLPQQLQVNDAIQLASGKIMLAGNGQDGGNDAQARCRHQELGCELGLRAAQPGSPADRLQDRRSKQVRPGGQRSHQQQ